MLKFFKSLFPEHSTYLTSSKIEDEATIEAVIQPGRLWRVYYQGTSWKARSNQNVSLEVGDTVYVVDRQNITLIVEPAPNQFN